MRKSLAKVLNRSGIMIMENWSLGLGKHLWTTKCLTQIFI